MNAVEILRDAERKLDHNEITLGEYEKLIEPLKDVRPVRRGRWKRKIVDCGFNADWVCSQCGHRVMTDFVNYNFCPNCGADMRKDGERHGTDIR